MGVPIIIQDTYRYVLLLSYVKKGMSFLGEVWAQRLKGAQKAKFELEWCLKLEGWANKWDRWIVAWGLWIWSMYFIHYPRHHLVHLFDQTYQDNYSLHYFFKIQQMNSTFIPLLLFKIVTPLPSICSIKTISLLLFSLFNLHIFRQLSRSYTQLCLNLLLSRFHYGMCLFFN